MGRYRFSTTWHLQAPRERVWEALHDAERYPQWWPGFERVDVLDPGAPDGTGRRIRFTTRSRLPYRLTFETVARQVRTPDHVLIEAVGELDGVGVGQLHQDGEITTATYRWEVDAPKAWMALLAPFARPAFVWNHHVIMAWGGRGLARHLDGRLLGHEAAPPVRLTDWAPLGGLVAGVGVLVALWARR